MDYLLYLMAACLILFVVSSIGLCICRSGQKSEAPSVEDRIVRGMIQTMNQSCKCCGAIMGSCPGGKTGEITKCPDYLPA